LPGLADIYFLERRYSGSNIKSDERKTQKMGSLYINYFQTYSVAGSADGEFLHALHL
jgi:hypothetical protein